jgi:hypothetical protein
MGTRPTAVGVDYGRLRIMLRQRSCVEATSSFGATPGAQLTLDLIGTAYVQYSFNRPGRTLVPA